MDCGWMAGRLTQSHPEASQQTRRVKILPIQRGVPRDAVTPDPRCRGACVVLAGDVAGWAEESNHNTSWLT